MTKETDSLLYRYFKISYSTKLFILMSVLSCGIYAYFWFIKLLEKFPKEDVRYSILLIFAVIAIPEWLDFFDLFFNFSARTYNRIIYWCVIAIPYISYNYRNEFRNFVNKDGVLINIKTFYLVIFPVYYQFYVLRNTYIDNEFQQNAPLESNVSAAKATSKTDLNIPLVSDASASSTEMNKQSKNMDKEELRKKLIKLQALYKQGKISKEQYGKYIEYIKSLSKTYL